MGIHSYRIELKLNKTQGVLCAKGAGTARFAYNWKLGKLIEAYETAKVEQGLDKPKCNFGTAIDWHKELSLSEREWTCRGCGTHHDRDVNAAKNLQFFGAWLLDLVGSAPTKPNIGSSPRINACGDERLQFCEEQCSSMKQEFKSQNHASHSFA